MRKYMVNDWVDIDTPCKVLEVGEYHLYVEYPDGRRRYTNESPRDIPLASKIYRRNGFKREGDVYYGDDPYSGLYIEIEGGEIAVFSKSGDTHSELKTHIESVHELQQALRVLGLKELADNLNVM